MVYRDNFVVVVKVNGRILREVDGVVRLPFGCEYSILLKNLNNRKAVASITIDGVDVVDGQELLLQPNDDSELEGYLDGFRVTNKFKFIEKTAEISDHRGDKISDGILRVEYRFEAEEATKVFLNEEHHHHHHYPGWSPFRSYSANIGSGIKQNISGMSHGSTSGDVKYASSISSSNNIFHSSVTNCAADTTLSACMDSMELSKESLQPDNNEDGITVKGSESSQSLQTAWVGTLETKSHVISLQLRGYQPGSEPVKVKKPVTVRTKVSCETCGRRSKAGTKFCNNCGTALVKFA